MSLTKEIEELQTRAAQANIWKERYEEAIRIFDEFFKKMEEIDHRKVRISTKKNYTKTTGEENQVIQDLYVKLKSEEIYEIKRQQIIGMLEEKTGKTYTGLILQKILEQFEQMKGIQRKRGKEVIFYHIKKESPEKELLEALPKKFSFKQ